jgi:putative nucleotidyltransferase with HDIG domain
MNIFIVVGMDLLNKYNYTEIILDSKNAFLSVFFSTIFVIGTLPLWESIFNIVSPIKLLELSNPNQSLLKRLMIEAPGTYHHSLMVGNLAEEGAEAIGANGLLARAAAYYHDIGKLRRPYFYKENQFNDNIHNNISAATSASLIISHTTDGLTYADQYKVPPQIKDIIQQHHGTTLVAYFYFAAQKENGEAQISEDDFRYKGPKPQTRESAVVMLADSVEAAVRSLSDPTEEKMNMMIKKIIKDKLDDGQLDECNITLKDIDKISKAFISVLSGLFHQRIEYPEIVDNTAKKLNEVDPLEQKILKL